MNTAHVGDNNKNQIVRMIRECGPISRAEISRRLKMSKPSVSKNVAELLQAKIITEKGLYNNGVGRKSHLLTFNAVKAYVVGVDIGNFKIRAGLADLSENLIDLEETRIALVSPQRDGRQIIAQVERMIHQLCERNETDIASVMEVCIGIPGIRDAQSGKNLLTPFVDNWQDLDIVGYFEGKYDFSVSVINNVNAAAVAEYDVYCRGGEDYKNVVYINFGIGIGSGLILDGKLLQGKNCAAGEVAFCCLKSIPLYTSHKTGAFEQMVSAEYWVRKYNAQVEQERQVEIGNGDANIIFDRYDEGDPVAAQIIESMFESMMMLFINLTAILNLELIIIGGGVGERMKAYIPDMEHTVSAHVPFPPAIRCARLGSLSGVYGAVSEAVCKVLNDYKNLT